MRTISWPCARCVCFCFLVLVFFSRNNSAVNLCNLGASCALAQRKISKVASLASRSEVAYLRTAFFSTFVELSFFESEWLELKTNLVETESESSCDDLELNYQQYNFRRRFQRTLGASWSEIPAWGFWSNWSIYMDRERTRVFSTCALEASWRSLSCGLISPTPWPTYLAPAK